MLSEKYIAGLLDSDGCISMRYSKANEDKFYGSAVIDFTESVNKSCLLPMVQEMIGGNLREFQRVTNYGQSNMRYLTFVGLKAVSTLDRLRKFLVLKHGLSEFVCSRNGVVVSKIEKDEYKKQSKIIRATKQRYPNYLSRKWLAAYIDGNGTLTGALRPSGKYRPVISVTAWDKDIGVLELMKKQYGGSITIRQDSNAAQWRLSLEDPSKCIEFLEYIEHVEIVKPQRDYLLSWARKGNFQNGNEIRETMRQFLKSRVAQTKSLDVMNSNEAIVEIS